MLSVSELSVHIAKRPMIRSLLIQIVRNLPIKHISFLNYCPSHVLAAWGISLFHPPPIFKVQFGKRFLPITRYPEAVRLSTHRLGKKISIWSVNPGLLNFINLLLIVPAWSKSGGRNKHP